MHDMEAMEQLKKENERLRADNERLACRIESLQMLNQQLLQEKEQEVAQHNAWSGNLGNWYWNVRSNEVTFNPLIVTALGYDVKELPAEVPYHFFTDLLHPDDYPRTMEAMRAHLEGSAPVYEAEYRILAKDGSYRWHYDRGRITRTDEEGRPVLLAGIAFDITVRRQRDSEQQNAIHNEQAIHDLTRVRNHRALMETLQMEMDYSQHAGHDLCIVLLDLDDLKRVKKTWGHVFACKVLSDFTSIVQSSIRGSDTFGRHGEEEFLLILPETPLDTAIKIAERIRKAVEDHRFIRGIHVLVSAGVRQFTGEIMSDFIRLAGENLYKAKTTGKNKVV